jgi:PhzF family phenazine biosynthesis protein
MTFPLYVTDAFTDMPFRGNPAAVCLLPAAQDEAWMQAVATEMNLSETAFLVPRDDGHDLRWFTPAREVDLCGHATLASSHVLWETGVVDEAAPAVFHTRSGVLTARRNGAAIEMDFPAEPPVECPAPPELTAALGVTPAVAARNRFDWLVLVDTEAALHAVRPDFDALARLEERGVIVTAVSESDRYDFVSRYFAPAYGVNEDPVTGSAHCCLGPFWADRLGRDTLTGFQASPRGGVVQVRVAGDRVILGGHAVTVVKGELV